MLTRNMPPRDALAAILALCSLLFLHLLASQTLGLVIDKRKALRPGVQFWLVVLLVYWASYLSCSDVHLTIASKSWIAKNKLKPLAFGFSQAKKTQSLAFANSWKKRSTRGPMWRSWWSCVMRPVFLECWTVAARKMNLTQSPISIVTRGSSRFHAVAMEGLLHVSSSILTSQGQQSCWCNCTSSLLAFR